MTSVVSISVINRKLLKLLPLEAWFGKSNGSADFMDKAKKAETFMSAGALQ